jgi:hypothetical protein
MTTNKIVLENLYFEGVGNNNYLLFIVKRLIEFLQSRSETSYGTISLFEDCNWGFTVYKDKPRSSCLRFYKRRQDFWNVMAHIRYKRRSYVDSEQLLNILNDIPCDPNGEFAKWILESAPTEYKKKQAKVNKAHETRQKTKADKFSLRAQQAIVRDCKSLYAKTISSAIKERFPLVDFCDIYNISFKDDLPSLKYLQLLSDLPGPPIEEDGRLLYEGIVECLGKEDAERFFSTSVNKDVRRLGVVYGGYETAGLVDESNTVRLAAKKIHEKKVQES